LIILDEPTMGLSLSETQKVLDFVGTIKKSGKSCVFISHNVFHAFPSADRLIILDRGKVLGQYMKNEITEDDLIFCLKYAAKNGSLP